MSEPGRPTAAGVDPIELVDVGVRFGDNVALDGISFSVKRGEIAVIIGGSGAGKTTLARVIVGLPLVEHETLTQREIDARARALLEI